MRSSASLVRRIGCLLVGVSASGAVLAACVPSRSAVFGPVDRAVDQRLGLAVEWGEASSDARVSAAVSSLLSRPLTLDAALRIAIANNRHLQATYDGLGIAAGEIADATVLSPTSIDLNHKYAVGGSGSETELDVVQDLLDLVQIAQRRSIASAELRGAQARAIGATVDLAAEVEVAFLDVVAAQQAVELRQTAFDAASASAEVVERMHAAGNTSDLALARERDLREQSRIELGRSRVAVEVSRESVNRLLGLSGAPATWSVAARLPDVPATVPALDDLEPEAVAQSLALVALHADAAAANGRLRYARVRAWLPELGVGVAVARRDADTWETGPALRLGLPIFNQQQGPRAKARAQLHRARNELAATAVDIRATARAIRQRVLGAHAEARHMFDVVLPLRQAVLDETLLQYNAMNATTFELLAARRELVDAGQQYIDAVRRYWSAMAEATALRRGGRATAPPATTESP